MKPAQVLDCQADMLRILENNKFTRNVIKYIFESCIVDPTATSNSIVSSVFQQAHDRVSTPTRATTRQERLRDAFTASTSDAAIRAALEPQVAARDDIPGRPESLIPKLNAWSHLIISQMTSTLMGAYAYRVSKDMCDLVEYAAAKLNDDDLFDAELAPTGCGLVFFESGVSIYDARGKRQIAHWLLWGPGRTPGDMRPITMMHWFNDLVIQPDEVAIRATELMTTKSFEETAMSSYISLGGRYSYIASVNADHMHPVGPAQREVDPTARQKYLEAGIEPSKFTNPVRLVLALWSLLGQSVTNVEEYTERKKSRKRKVGKVPIPGRVSVVTLRRIENFERHVGESHVEWQHRWMVRGHWRNQRYGTQRQQVKRIWINPFWKGPEDAPLIQTEKVYDLRR